VELGLSGRRALVTGGSKGLGKAIAAELVTEGAAVVICSRNADELQATAVELTGLAEQAAGPDGERGSVLAVPCDVTDPEQVIALVEGTASALGGLDVLVNNAGGARPGQFGTLTDDDWHEDIEVKLFSQIRCIRAALPHLRRSAAPRVININALYARYPDPAFLASSVNRASCLSLSKALSMELGGEGILVNSVNIGFVETPQWDNIHRRRAPEMPAAEFFGQLAKNEVPLGRFGLPEEVAGLVTFLASDRASYIAGASIDVGGGMGKYL
jgi:NAD(P)-dependent dehydrogenase (short-subunit alcohol dehydrogenase family)